MGKLSKTKDYLLLSTVACIALCGTARTADAFEYDFNDGIVIHFDNTVQYSLAVRAAKVSSYLGGQTGGATNTNDGDDNLASGVISNRIDVLSKFDISYNNFGFDASADSFYDTVYNQDTQNKSGASYNPAQTPYNKFTSETEVQAGRNIELRNLFVYGSTTIDGVPVTLRVGRLVNLFGESLLFASNGIAYGQAPIDIARAVSVPNTQAKDLFLPVGQALLSAQLSDSVSVSAYYQFEWEKFNFIPTGSYFSIADLFDQGGQRIYAGPAGPGSAVYFYRAKDLSGADTGQFGLAVHYDPVGSPWDFGFYALQYNDSEPQIYTEPHYTFIHGVPHVIPSPGPAAAPGSPFALSLGTYQVVYANHIQIYGASTSTTIGPLNLAGEASVRANEDLRSTVTLGPGQIASNTANPLYAIGDVAHYQASAIYLGPKIPGLWGGSTVLGEVAGENLFAISSNKDNFNRAGARHMALGLRTIASVTYYELLPGLDVSPKIGLGWNFMGLSPDTGAFNGTGIDRGGDITLGVGAIYLNKWIGGVSYTRYISPAQRDPYADRDFVALNVERTF